jgi:predicted ATPase
VTLLLLLDNVEHLLDATPLVADLLASAPGLRVLATSRAALRLQGEHLYPVEPLATADLASLPDLDALARVPAVDLLLQRARAVLPTFALSAATAPAVAALCRQLDGLPLALELAAVRLTVLSPQVLSRRLERRLPLLTGGSRDLPERQRTMSATLAWSYDLLGAEERTLFRHLSVFAGGCRLEAAEAVSMQPVEVVADVLGALMEKSLLQRSLDADGEPRFMMLETVREYGRERLEESGDGQAAHERHATYCLALAEAAAPELIGAEQSRWLARLEEERDNLRAALQWSQEGSGEPAEDRVEIGLRTAATLWRFWFRRGYLDEGRRWLEGLLAAAPSAGRTKAQALHGAAGLAWAQGAYDQATAHATGSLALHRDAGDTAGIADALQMLGVIAADQADYAVAAARAEECLALRRELGDTWGSATALHNLGVVAHQRGDYARAEELYDESLALKRTLGDTAGIAVTLRNLGDALAAQRQYERGTALIEESLALHRQLGVTEAVNPALTSLGVIARRMGDDERARSLLEEGLKVAREQGARAYEALALVSLGDLARDRGATIEAIALYQEGLSLADEVGQQVEVAYGLEGLAATAPALGQARLAAHLFGAAEALREAIDTPLLPIDLPDYDRGVAAVRAALGKDAMAASWAAGRALSVECAIDEALTIKGYP